MGDVVLFLAYLGGQHHRASSALAVRGVGAQEEPRAGLRGVTALAGVGRISRLLLGNTGPFLTGDAGQCRLGVEG